MSTRKQDPARRLSFLYIAALSSIGLIAIFSQVIIHRNIETQKSDSKVINLSGRQRMLSQRLTKDLLLFKYEANTIAREGILERIHQNHQEWKNSHAYLTDHTPRSDKGLNSNAVSVLFGDLQPYFNAIDSACVDVMQSGADISGTDLQPSVARVLTAEPLFLNYMDRITHQYEVEASNRVKKLKRIELILLIFTLAILFIEGRFVLMPAVQKLRLYFNKLQESNTALNAATEELTESRRFLLSNALVAQENERKRIAMDLHDGLGPLIALTKMHVEHLEPELSNKGKTEALKTLKYLDEISLGIRTISYALMPSAMEQFGLKTALENLVEESQHAAPSDISLYYNLPAIQLNSIFQLNIYRLVQELLHNAIRHAKAKAIAVQVFIEDTRIVIMVEDDGQGFHRKDALQGEGFGLKNLISRVNAFAGSFNIDTDAENGTTVTIYLPIPQTHGAHPDHTR